MAKIFSSDLHANDNSSIQFGAAIVGLVWDVRQQMAILAKSKKADEYAPGALHALRKLCEGEGKSSHIHQKEVEEWQETFLAWFNRVKRWFPKELVEEFRANAEEDFRFILQCASGMPEFFWRKDVPKRQIKITFENDEALDAARKAADQKHPVQLGSALHTYLESCVAELVGDEPIEASSPPITPTDPDSICVRFAFGVDELLSVIVEGFDCFDNSEDLDQDIVVTAYDIEEAVKAFLSDNQPDAMDSLQFDCESSAFVVRSSSLQAISHVTEVLFAMAASQNLFGKYRQVR